MTSQLHLVAQESLQRLYSLKAIREKLAEEQAGLKRLCECAEIFLPALKDFEDPDVVSQKVVDIPDLSRALELLVKLLAEIQDFVTPLEDDRSFFKMARKMIVNVEIQTKMQTQIESFHARINDIQSVLLPGYSNSFDLKKDIKMTFDMEAMVDCVIKDLIDHNLDIEYLKATMNELIDNCSEQKLDVKSKLLALHSTLSTNLQPKQKDIDNAVTSLHKSLRVADFKARDRALNAESPVLLLHCCCYHLRIPVELRMIVCQYGMLKTELSHVSTFEAHKGEVYALVFSEVDHTLFSGSNDNTIKVWDTGSKTCITTLQGHKIGICCVYISPQMRRLFSGASDATIKVWDTETWQCLHTLKGHSNIVTSLVLDENANILFSSSQDKTIKVWDLHTLTCIRTLQGHRDGVWCLCLSLTSNRLFSGSNDKTIKGWNTVSYECVSTMEGHSNYVLSLCLSEDGSRLYSGSSDKTIKVWDTATNACTATLQGHVDTVRSLCPSFKTNRLISASYDKTIRVWDTTTNTCIHTVTDAHRDEIFSLALSDDSDTLYSAGGQSWGGNKDFTIKAWKLRHAWA
jgi:WD40 repeat protein